MPAISFLDSILRDLLHAARLMRKSPGFTATAMLTLLLGIGANTIVFSLVDATLIRALPFRDPDRLVALGSDNRIMTRQEFLRGEIFQVLRERSNTIDCAAMIWARTFDLTAAAVHSKIEGASVSPSLFRVLGVNAERGRIFRDDEEQKGRDAVALIGHNLWQRYFDGDDAVVGKPVTLNGASYTIVGVMPTGFAFPEGKAEVWTPLAPSKGMSTRTIARLKDGVTPQQARAELAAIDRALTGSSQGEAGPDVVFVSSLHDTLTREVKPALTVLFVAVAVVLLIAAANLANLMAARSKMRVKEFAIRTALGASPSRLVRQSLVESLALTITGGCLGLILSYWGIGLFVAASPMRLRSEYAIGIDMRVLLFTAAASILTGVLMSLRGVWEVSRTEVQASLKDTKPAPKSGLGFRLRSGSLVVFQVAVGLTMLIAGGLLLRSFIALITVDPGYAPERVLTARIDLPSDRYGKRPQQEAFYRDLTEHLAALPEVEGVAVAGTGLPLTDKSYGTFRPEGWPKDGEAAFTDFAKVSPSYFSVMKLRLLKGRFFDERDTAQSQRVVVISEALAKRFFPGQDPVGKTIESWRPHERPDVIVGIVADVKFYGLDKNVLPCLYYSTLQPGSPFGISDARLVIRTRGLPGRLVPALRTLVARTDASVVPLDIKTMDDRIWESVAQPRFYTALMGGFALSALLLVLLGNYSIVAFMVKSRTREIGLRIALGARSGEIYRLIIGQSLPPTLLGIAIGIALSWALARFLASLLFGILPHDAVSFAILPMLLALTVTIACYLPARRAARLDPMAALRDE